MDRHKLKQLLHQAGQGHEKQAYAAPAPVPPAGGAMPPMDPAMAGGMPPMDPAMMGAMPPAGGAMPPMDPAMMAGGMPPMDPAMAGGMPPVDPMTGMPMDPAMMGAMPPMGGAGAGDVGSLGPDTPPEAPMGGEDPMREEMKGIFREVLQEEGLIEAAPAGPEGDPVGPMGEEGLPGDPAAPAPETAELMTRIEELEGIVAELASAQGINIPAGGMPPAMEEAPEAGLMPEIPQSSVVPPALDPNAIPPEVLAGIPKAASAEPKVSAKALRILNKFGMM